MNKIKLIFPITLCIIIFAGCTEVTPEERQQIQRQLQEMDNANRRSDLHTVDYHGHSYIIYQGRYKGGIIHDPDCQCHQKEEELPKTEI